MNNIDILDNELTHYGTPRHSGRYPYGSGKDAYQRTGTFLSTYDQLHKDGLTDKEIADGMGMSLNQLRARRSQERDAERAYNIARAQELKEHGNSTSAIGRLMGVNESTVRGWLDEGVAERTSATKNVANSLKDELKKQGGYLDIGKGVELELNCSATKLATAADMLQQEGYSVITLQVPQATMKGQYTTLKVLAPEGTTKADILNNLTDIHTVTNYFQDGDTSNSAKTVKPPVSIDSSRVSVRFKEQGGADKDGVIELRRGVEDISLGASNYAQVRIAVDGTHYIKGMAMYSDNLPKGVDILVNSNKSESKGKLGALKPMKTDKDGNIDIDNPFGAAIMAKGQSTYIDKKTGEEKLRVINKLKEEGDWANYSKSLSSQFLSKQSKELIQRQLNLAYKDKADELDEITKLTNPAVKAKYLQDFANNCDSAAVHLKAAALPRQSTKVLLPLNAMAENEVYAPTYKNGEHVCLVRYPHAGTFEIPELVVNNNNPTAKRILGNAKDAIGINSKVASRLSGADFDGDTAMVIPTNSKVKIKTSRPLKGLENFEPKDEYPGYSGMKKMTAQQKGMQMGIVSNLITDMTLIGASEQDLVRAVKHSMVVIDAEKHGLDWKRSEKENDIAALHKKYQGKATGGASTLISKASSQAVVDEIKAYTKIDPTTGEKVFTKTGRVYTKTKTYKDGTTIDIEVKATSNTNKMTKAFMEGKDAYSLSSGTEKESYYADYANKVKSLANQARKELISTKPIAQNKEAKIKYSDEVETLNAKLERAKKNAPRERQAQVLAAAEVKLKKDANPDLKLKENKDELSKISQQALAKARARLGASKGDVLIDISNKEWEAIQSGAISHNKLIDILNNSDSDRLRELATPRDKVSVSSSKQAKIKSMDISGYTLAEIAEACGLSTSTVSQYL